MPEILPHPKRGTMEIGTERIMPVFGKIRAADGASDENPVVTIVGTDGSEDRHGSIINPRGWQTASYLRNPVALWSHGVVEEYPALGQTMALRSVGGAWEFDIRFALGPWKNMRDNLAQFLWEWYRDFGGPLAASVAFLPKDWADRQATEMPTFFAENVEYREQELTEISFVNVPSNRNAISKAIERARSAGTFTDGMAKMLGFSVSPIIIQARETTAPPMLTLALMTKAVNGADLTEPEIATLAEAVRLGVIAPGAALRDHLSAPTAPAAKRMPLPSLRLIITNTREALRYCYPDCSRCAPSCTEYCDMCGREECNDKDALTGDAATAEQQTISSAIDVLAQELGVALAGWDSSEHDALSDWCSMRVMDCMWSIDRLLRFMDCWYPEQQPMDTTAVNPDEVRKFIAGVEASAELKQLLTERAIVQSTRVGAELSAKNQARLRKMHVNADEIVQACADMLGVKVPDEAPADETERATPFIRIKTSGPSSLSGDEGTGQTIRIVSASDAPGAGTGDRSTPADQHDLYGQDVLPIRARS